jgi:hypothetical protein
MEVYGPLRSWTLLFLMWAPALALADVCADKIDPTGLREPVFLAPSGLPISRPWTGPRLAAPSQDTAIEAEVDTDERLLATLEGPPEAKGRLREWILEDTERRRQMFYEDHLIHGVHFPRDVALSLPYAAEFRGQPVPAILPTRVSLAGFLLPEVEFATNESVQDLGTVELHFREKRLPSELLNDVRVFESGMRWSSPLHAHLVSRNAPGGRRLAPALRGAYVADFIRRLNATAEMEAYLFQGATLRPSSTFNFMDRTLLRSLASELMRAFRDGRPFVIGQQFFKFMAVGFHPPGKYDDPGLWGLQFRALSETAEATRVGVILDAAQWGMHTGKYGIPIGEFGEWLERIGGEPLVKSPGRSVRFRRIAKAMGELYHNPQGFTWFRPNEKYILAADALAPVVAKAGLRSAAFSEFLVKHPALRFLLHDWSRDWVVLRDPDLAPQILAAQRAAIAEIGARFPYANNLRADDQALFPIVSGFLVRTGIFSAYLRSIGIRAQ